MAKCEPELEQRKRLVAMLLAGGGIVGSHAFTLYANMLGVVWDMGSTRTQDIDVVVDNSLNSEIGSAISSSLSSRQTKSIHC